MAQSRHQQRSGYGGDSLSQTDRMRTDEELCLPHRRSCHPAGCGSRSGMGGRAHRANGPSRRLYHQQGADHPHASGSHGGRAIRPLHSQAWSSCWTWWTCQCMCTRAKPIFLNRFPIRRKWERRVNQVVDLGGDVEITLIHTPGHTPGSQCFLVQNQSGIGRYLIYWGLRSGGSAQ